MAGSKKISRSDMVVENMINAIKEGKFELHSKLPSESILAEEFGVSRTTLREAFKKLEQLGTISIKHGSGTYVNGMLEDRVDKITEIINTTFKLQSYQVTQYLDARMMLELTAIDLAIDRMDDTNYFNLKSILERSENADCTGEEYVELDCQYHREIIKASKNEFLYQFWTFIEPCLREQQKELIDVPDIFNNSKIKHREIYEDFLLRDKKAAKDHIKEHLSLILGRFFTKATGSNLP